MPEKGTSTRLRVGAVAEQPGDEGQELRRVRGFHDGGHGTSLRSGRAGSTRDRCGPVDRREPATGWGGADGAAYPGGMDDYWVAVFWSLLPTVVVSAIFFFILRSIIRADRTERRDYARIEAEERAKLGLASAPAPKRAALRSLIALVPETTLGTRR